MKTLEIKPSPEVQAAMRQTALNPDALKMWLVDSGAAIEELTMQFAVQQQMLRDVWGIKKYEERRDKAIATLFPPTEEAKEIERLKAQVDALENELALRKKGYCVDESNDAEQDEPVEQEDETEDE